MALPKSYLTSTKNLPAILSAIQQAKAPERFTIRFLESLEFKASSDRLIVGVLKSLGFLDDQGRPTQRYYRFLDQTQSATVLAEGLREAYNDLFSVNINAQNLSKNDLINKFKTLSQGSLSESVLEKLALTFQSLAKLADFSAASARQPIELATEEEVGDEDINLADSEPRPQTPHARQPATRRAASGSLVELGGLHYNIQIILPESRDPLVYDALFRSLREHLF